MSQKSSWMSNIAQIVALIVVFILFNKYACSRDEITSQVSVTVASDSTNIETVNSNAFKVLAREREHMVDTLSTNPQFVRKAVLKEVNFIVDKKEQELDSLVRVRVLTINQASTRMNSFIRNLMYGK